MNDGMKKDRDRTIAEDEARIAAMRDEDIDTEDIPEVLDWGDAVRGKFYRPSLERRTVRNNSCHTQEMNEDGIQNNPDNTG